MTKFNANRWDKGEFSKRKPINDEDKRAMTEYYEAGLKTGKLSSELLEELEMRYRKSARQIQRYIREVKESHVLEDNIEDGEGIITDFLSELTEDEIIDDLEKREVPQEQEKLEAQVNAISICTAPPDDIDVYLLRSWGVPLKKAAQILYDWRTFHKEGSHEKCESYRNLENDLKALKIPFKEAEINLIAEIEGKEIGGKACEIALAHIDIRRKYRPWESDRNYKAFVEEAKMTRETIINDNEGA